MPNLWERTHETVLDNELRKAQADYRRTVVSHGREMLVIGIAIGAFVAWAVLVLL